MKARKLQFLGSLGFVASFLLASLLFMVSSCDSKPPENSMWVQAEKGKVHFENYCSRCHGDDATGLVIDSLLTQPADLTKIVSSGKSGEFPLRYVVNKIDGRSTAKAHGSREMPIWGKVFTEEELLDDAQVKTKLGEIIAYLISIQR